MWLQTTPSDLSRPAIFHPNNLNSSNSVSEESKFSTPVSEFQSSSEANQRLWQSPSVVTSMASEAALPTGYPHVHPHQLNHKSFLPPHYSHHHQSSYVQPPPNHGLQPQAHSAAAVYSATQAGLEAAAASAWPSQPHHASAPIHVNYIMNSNVIHNYRHPHPPYYPAQ